MPEAFAVLTVDAENAAPNVPAPVQGRKLKKRRKSVGTGKALKAGQLPIADSDSEAPACEPPAATVRSTPAEAAAPVAMDSIDEPASVELRVLRVHLAEALADADRLKGDLQTARDEAAQLREALATSEQIVREQTERISALEARLVSASNSPQAVDGPSADVTQEEAMSEGSAVPVSADLVSLSRNPACWAAAAAAAFGIAVASPRWLQSYS